MKELLDNSFGKRKDKKQFIYDMCNSFKIKEINALRLRGQLGTNKTNPYFSSSRDSSKDSFTSSSLITSKFDSSGMCLL